MWVNVKLWWGNLILNAYISGISIKFRIGLPAQNFKTTILEISTVVQKKVSHFVYLDKKWT